MRSLWSPGRLVLAANVVAAAVFVLLFAPATASAAAGCLFGGMKAPAAGVGKVERSLLCLTNVHRLRSGLEPLRRDTRLGEAARAHSRDMVARGYFGHTDLEGRGPSDRAQAAGYPGGAGENIAANSTGSALSLFDQWRDSDGHNQNMLGGGYRSAGFGVAAGFPGDPGPGSVTGTQMFGSADANTGDTGLGLYSSGGRCAKAKRGYLRLRARAEAASKRANRRALWRRARAAQDRVDARCEPPPGV